VKTGDARGSDNLEISSTNGAAYGNSVAISAASGSAGASLSGTVRISNVSSTIAASRGVLALVAPSIGSPTATVALNIMNTNTAAVVDAIRFGGGNFDAGTIRVYGVK